MSREESATMRRRRKMTGDKRPFEEIRQHYDLELELASQLRSATPAERRVLYTSLYDRLFRELPHHPQLSMKANEAMQDATNQQKIRLVRRYIDNSTAFLELGPGDCSFSLRLTSLVARVYAVDVSPTIAASNESVPANFELAISDGSSVPLPDNSIDVAYSNQLMEHLHPDDAATQLNEIFRVLKPGGYYICITPSRLCGPHDVSGYFDSEAKGFHLREYTSSELQSLFRAAGISRFETYAGGKGYYVRVPAFCIKAVDTLVELLPPAVRHSVSTFLPVRALLGAIVVAVKAI